jgi:predicted porin
LICINIFGDLRMKKSLIALAALSAFATAAQAQSSITIYGILDAGYSDRNSETLRYVASSNSVAKDKVSVNGINGNGNESTSRLGFRGTEDLGGGLKANFVFETALNPAESTLSAFNNRQAFVGLEGGFGTITAGTVYSQAHIISAGFSASTLPNVVGDVMYVQSGGSLGQTFDKFGITTTGVNSSKTTAAAYNGAFTALTSNLAATTGAGLMDAKLNAELVKFGVAATIDGATLANTAVTVVTTDVLSGTKSAHDATSVALADANKTIAAAKTLVDAAATATLHTRLARASNISYNVRTNNTVTYMSPDMSGFKIGGQYSLPTQTKTEGRDEATSSSTQLSLNYAAGKFAAAVAQTTGELKTVSIATTSVSFAPSLLTTLSTASGATAVAKTVATAVAATAPVAAATVEVKTKELMSALSYDLGVAKVSYIYTKRDAKDTVSDLSEKTTHSFGVKAPFGKVTAFAIYSMGDTKVLEGTADAAKFDLDGTQVGVSYAMSKRTDAYVIYGTNKMDNVANANDIKDKQYAIGLRHQF